MSDEKMIKNEELSEEQLDKVSGGSPEDVDPSKKIEILRKPELRSGASVQLSQ